MRTVLRIEATRIERLRDITDADATAEGVDSVSMRNVPRQGTICRRDDFAQLWAKINGADSWKANPWVWVVSFRVATPPAGDGGGG